MKKLFVIFSLSLLLVGCGSYGENDVLYDLNEMNDDMEAYVATGTLDILNNDQMYNYDVEVSYKKGDYYRVILTNTDNKYTQIILKNDEGVFVLTPALNKSFKFQSEWPYSDSQSYIISSIIADIDSDKDREYKEVDNGYEFITKINYPNNDKLVRQKILLDKELSVKEVTVYDSNDVEILKMSFSNIDYEPNFLDDHFDLEAIMKEFAPEEELVEDNSEENNNAQDETVDEDSVEEEQDKAEEDTEIDSEVTGLLEDSIYPLFIPDGTKLVSEEEIVMDDGKRIIMTFDGEKSFLLVQETVKAEDEMVVIPTFGEPYQLLDTLGVMTDNSLTWHTGGVEYYIVSDVLSTNELIEVAQSISVLPTMK